MIKTKKQTNMDTDNNIPVSKYLRSLMQKIVSGKFVKVLLFILVLMFFNIGAKYPAMSGTNINKSSVDTYAENIERDAAKLEYEKYLKMYQEIYESSMIQQIEFESEILIPEYFEFKYVEFTYKVASEVGISTRVMFRLMFKESSFDDDVVSKAGAEGLMQLMPDTRATYYKNLRVDTLHLDRNQEDIYIGAYYIKDLQEFWHKRGNSQKNLLKLSLAAYNAGAGKVIEYKGVPPYKETTEFITFILKPHSNPTFYANILNKNSKKEVS
jgi:soluble lytic murein transglycosylase-like protein